MHCKVPIKATLVTFRISSLWGSNYFWRVIIFGEKKPWNKALAPYSEMKNNDSQRAQTADRIKLDHSDEECQTTLGLAPTDAISKIQPLNVAMNAEIIY